MIKYADFSGFTYFVGKRDLTAAQLNQALQHCAAEILPRCTAYLLKRGADPKVVNIIKVAGKKDGHKVLKRLVETKKIDLNMINSDGETALIAAVKEGLTENAAYLVDQGADVNIVTKYGCTALDIAIREDSGDIEDTLKKASALRAARIQMVVPRTSSATPVQSALINAVLQMSGIERRRFIEEIKEKCGADFSIVANPVALQKDLGANKAPLKKSHR